MLEITVYEYKFHQSVQSHARAYYPLPQVALTTSFACHAGLSFC